MTVFLNKRSKTYVFLRYKLTVFTLIIMAGSRDKNGSVFNFLYLLKESK